MEINGSQPSCVVALGFGGQDGTVKGRIKAIAINDLTGRDTSGAPLPGVAAIVARYPGALVLPSPGFLAPLPIAADLAPGPLFVKDDEARTMAQLSAFARRELAKHQQKYCTLSYEVPGHTQNGHPWASNTNVTVNDERRGFVGTAWIKDLTVSKSGKAGTKTKLELILPHTLELGA